MQSQVSYCNGKKKSLEYPFIVSLYALEFKDENSTLWMCFGAALNTEHMTYIIVQTFHIRTYCTILDEF